MAETIPPPLQLPNYSRTLTLRTTRPNVKKMPKSLSKVQKKLSKKKGNISSLHENSRDAQKLRRAEARSEKLERLAAARAKANQPHCMLAVTSVVI